MKNLHQASLPELTARLKILKNQYWKRNDFLTGTDPWTASLSAKIEDEISVIKDKIEILTGNRPQ